MVLALQGRLVKAMRAEPATFRTAEEWAEALGVPAEAETLWKLLEHLAANPGRGVARRPAATPFDATYNDDASSDVGEARRYTTELPRSMRRKAA